MVNKQKTKKINKLKPRSILKRSKLSKKKYSLKRSRKNLLKNNPKTKPKLKSNTKTKKYIKTKHKGGDSFYNENGYDIIRNVDLDLDLTNTNKKIYSTRYAFEKTDDFQLKYINNKSDIKNLLETAMEKMNINLIKRNFVGMELLIKKIKNGKIKSSYYLFSKKKYSKTYTHLRNIKRCGILYFYSIPNNYDLNLQLSIGKKIIKKGLFKNKKKVIIESNTIPIEEKMAILIRHDTFFKFKMNNITLDEPIVILDFSLRCGDVNLFN